MSYTIGEAAILTRVQACTGFNTSNACLMNWKLLNQGANDHYAMLKVGPAEFEWLTMTTRRDYYQTYIFVYQRYLDEITSYKNIKTHVNNLLAMFSYPNMGAAATVFDSNITEWSDLEETWTAGENGPGWLSWRLTVAWSEITEVTFSE